MRSFTTETGRLAVLLRPNVDTDQIIPKQFLKAIGRTGFGPALFHDWRYRADGSDDPAFELNRPEARGAAFLLAGPNFGCGSSREHAAWALAQYGFRAVIGTTFADIFFDNAVRNGLVPVRLDAEAVAELARRAADGVGYEVTVDLGARTVRDGAGFAAAFPLDDYRREMLMHGLDEIALTLRHEAAIAAHEARLAQTPA
ncbi:MAG: 3-isopropylmalate dehydratase small subunit [Gemmatimonadales bacterium]|nr:3-isopropylmalate dehydratase small subunit [Gemmatimonadales bacterium]